MGVQESAWSVPGGLSTPGSSAVISPNGVLAEGLDLKDGLTKTGPHAPGLSWPAPHEEDANAEQDGVDVVLILTLLT